MSRVQKMLDGIALDWLSHLSSLPFSLLPLWNSILWQTSGSHPCRQEEALRNASLGCSMGSSPTLAEFLFLTV